MLNRRLTRCCGPALLLLGAWSASWAADWPQFRGPARDGVSAEAGLLDPWPAAGPAILWRAPLGEGFSAVSVVGDSLYTLFASGGEEFVGSFAVATGKERWRAAIGAKWTDRFGNGPRSTPTVDGGLVFGLGSKGRLVALNAKDGGVVWQSDLKADFGARAPEWGVATSPLVVGDRLLVDVGGREGNALIAFDKKSGKVLWRAGNGEAGYAAPLFVNVGGVAQVLFFRAAGLVAVSPTDGAELWRLAWKTSYDVNAAMPVFVPPDKVFVSSGYDVGAALLQIRVSDGKASAAEVWRTREMKNQFSSSVYFQGYLYGFDDKTLKCIDAQTGATMWRHRELGHGSLILAGGLLIALGDAGTLVLAVATPDGYVQRGRLQAFKGKTWTMPSLSGGRLFLRDERELLALNVAGAREAGDPKQTAVDQSASSPGKKP